MKINDLILLAPAIAFAGGLTGLIQHADYPGDVLFLSTSIALFAIGVATFGGLFLLLRANLPDTPDNKDN
nr:hypothetical protein [uncultured Hyphomonas sp.]